MNSREQMNMPYFKEADRVVSLVCEISATSPFPVPATSDATGDPGWLAVRTQLAEEDARRDTIIKILKPYAEQPKLLDSHLEDIVQKLLAGFISCITALNRYHKTGIHSETIGAADCKDAIQGVTELETTGSNGETPKPTAQQLQLAQLRIIQDIDLVSSLLYTVCLVRRPKSVAHHFLTDVEYLELVLVTLEDLVTPIQLRCSGSGLVKSPLLFLHDPGTNCDPRTGVDHRDTPWMLLYVLLQWMSLLILVPFKIHSFGDRLRCSSSQEPQLASLPRCSAGYRLVSR